MTPSENNLFKRHPLAIYFILAFGFTWLILSPGLASTLGLLKFNLDGTVLTILAGLGPLLATAIVLSVTEGGQGVRKIFHSMFNWRVKARWWAAAVLLVAGLFAVSAGLSWLTGGALPDPAAGVYLNGGNLLAIILLLLIGSFGEEAGWRGFALPHLQKNLSPIKATLVLNVFWWLWHLPTYWTLPMAINSVQQFGFAAAYGIQFIVLLALGILCAWVFNGSGGVVLMPVLLHASWNFWIGAFGQEVSLLLLPLFLLVAILVGLATRGRLGAVAGPKKGQGLIEVPHGR